MNGIQLNDAMTGYTPWSLWSGLNDATRNQEVTTGLQMGEMGIGGIGGVTNINTRPSQMRKGFRASLVNSNSMYRFRYAYVCIGRAGQRMVVCVFPYLRDKETMRMSTEFTTMPSAILQPWKNSSMRSTD